MEYAGEGSVAPCGVESYRSSSVSSVDTRTPGRLRLSRPIVTPPARTNNDGQRLSGADEFGQLIHR